MPAAVDFLSSVLSPRNPLTNPILLNRYIKLTRLYMYGAHVCLSPCDKVLYIICRDCSPGGFYVTPGPEEPCFQTCLPTTTCIAATVPEEHLRVCNAISVTLSTNVQNDSIGI